MPSFYFFIQLCLLCLQTKDCPTFPYGISVAFHRFTAGMPR
jgi:hypothetical protein